MNPKPAHLQNDTDQIIDRALSTIREATPRAGLHDRILASLEHRAVAPQRIRPHFSIHLALWSATAAAVIAIASFLVLHHRTTQGHIAYTPQTHLQPRLAVPQISMEQTDPIPRHPERSAPPRSRIGVSGELARRGARTPVFESCADHHTTGCPIHDDVHVVMAGEPNDLDAQALADFHAPSHPAPPLPLTPQEKLFLRVLRYGNATQLAELNPNVRTAHDAEETTAFETFFPDPPPLKQPGDDE
jgi:hypothetical protein